jgi:tRNA nucleotidyltransferase (CCA-adding enzyme)
MLFCCQEAAVDCLQRKNVLYCSQIQAKEGFSVRIPAPPPPVARVLSELRGAGFEAYLVGGCVRDAALGRVPPDWDVCTSATPGEALRALRAHRVVPTGEAFGTVTAIVGGLPVEVTTYRADGAYSDGRRPDSVRFSRTLGEDLSRRDLPSTRCAWTRAAKSWTCSAVFLTCKRA